MSKILFFSLLCCLLMTASVSPGEVRSSGAVTAAPDEGETIEDPDSVQNIRFANFKDTLNDIERKLAIRHPIQAFRVYLAASRAEETTVRLYGSNGFQDNADAFRHCLWNALMKKSVGEDAAREWANAHEAYSEGVDREIADSQRSLSTICVKRATVSGFLAATFTVSPGSVWRENNWS